MALVIERTNSWSRERLWPFWPSVLECLQKLVDEFPQEYSLSYIVNEMNEGRRDLWIVHEPDDPEPRCILACITRVAVSVVGRRTIEMTECGGERVKDALHLIQDVERWAAGQGIEHARFVGRPGWYRLLRPYGYARRVETLEKNIGGQHG